MMATHNSSTEQTFYKKEQSKNSLMINQHLSGSTEATGNLSDLVVNKTASAILLTKFNSSFVLSKKEDEYHISPQGAIAHLSSGGQAKQTSGIEKTQKLFKGLNLRLN